MKHPGKAFCPGGGCASARLRGAESRVNLEGNSGKVVKVR